MYRHLGWIGFATFALVGCASTPVEDDASGEDDITSVQDLGAMETELALVKDVKAADGAFKRANAKLEAGPCFKRTKGGSAGADYQVRRYTKGAAFFKKLGTAPATGDDRPVICLDVDTKDGTVDIGRFELDLMMRYGLGPETKRQIDPPHSYDPVFVNFARGFVAFGSSKPAPDSVETPRFLGMELLFLDVNRLPKGVQGSIDGSLAKLVFEFAWRSARAEDAFSLKDDPVGKLVSADGDAKSGEPDTVPQLRMEQHFRFEHLDAHHVFAKTGESEGGFERLYLTPKLSDSQLTERAQVTCERTIDFMYQATSKFTCTGL